MFKGKIDFNDLLSNGTTFKVDVSEKPADLEDDLVSQAEYDEEVSKHFNFQCIDSYEDNEVYTGKEPFEVLSTTMTDISPSGKLKKKILRAGYEPGVARGSIVKVHYNAYVEFNHEPFDCTYARKHPTLFTIDNGEVIIGLELAVLSMKLNEKSQFLIHPDLAYGKMGCLGRVPQNATILFEVELIEIIDAAAAEQFEYLPPEKKEQFSEVYKYCISQCAKAKELFGRNYRSAVREYNKAVGPLENVHCAEFDEQTKQQELLYKLYSNLLICYTKLEEPKKGCIAFNKINDMARGTDFKINAKVYYNNAKCLRMLSDFALARKRLDLALRLAPRNPDILNEFKIIDEKEKAAKEKEKKLCKAFTGNLNLSNEK